jgi:drug/metabolite transporter (DMT)-like permease
MTKLIEHSYIIMTVFFTVYSQIIMRWQVAVAGPLPGDLYGKVGYILNIMLSPWVLSGVVATFLAGVSWMLAMTKFEISYAFPFVSLNYIFVLAAGFFLFNEPINLTKLVGGGLVVLGLIVIAKG